MNEIDFSKIRNIKAMNSLAKDSFVSYLGIKITKITKNFSQAKLKISKKIKAPNGLIHGGAITSLADTACGFGTMYHLKQEMFATIELQTNFISAVEKGTLICNAKLVHKGKSLHVWDAEVIEEKNLKIVALFRCTQMIIKTKKEKNND